MYLAARCTLGVLFIHESHFPCRPTSLPSPARLPVDPSNQTGIRAGCYVCILFAGHLDRSSADDLPPRRTDQTPPGYENRRNYKVMLLYSLVELRPPRSRPHLNQHIVTAIGSDFRHLPTPEMPASLEPRDRVLSSESLGHLIS